MSNDTCTAAPEDTCPIQTVDLLRKYLHVAMQVEHATIPVYLTALYSIKGDRTGPNGASIDIIREVVVEEMLHLTLAANMLNAIGGTPDMLAKDFLRPYPAPLPTGETDFFAHLQKFSKETIVKVFMEIERPAEPVTDEACVELGGIRYVKHEDLHDVRKNIRGLIPHVHTQSDSGEDLHLHYWSIGDFYKAVLLGFEHLYSTMGDKLFSGDPARQIDPKFYFSGGGELFTITNIQNVRDAVNLISEQGEGFGGDIVDERGELSHYYRFDQIARQQYYVTKLTGGEKDDEPDQPTGKPFPVIWDEVYPIVTDAKVAMYPEGSEVREAALKFNRRYWTFLEKLNRGFNGNPSEFETIYKDMFALRDAATQLIRNPLPSGEGNAAPTFEMNALWPEKSEE